MTVNIIIMIKVIFLITLVNYRPVFYDMAKTCTL